MCIWQSPNISRNNFSIPSVCITPARRAPKRSTEFPQIQVTACSLQVYLSSHMHCCNVHSLCTREKHVCIECTAFLARSWASTMRAERFEAAPLATSFFVFMSSPSSTTTTSNSSVSATGGDAGCVNDWGGCAGQTLCQVQ